MYRDVQFNCQYMAGLNFYDLQPLDIARTYYNFTNPLNPERSIMVSFCNDLPETLWCDLSRPSLAVLIDSKSGTCTPLSGSDSTKNAKFDVAEPDENDGIEI
jgi:hypothetical protein